jgi:hypothetical protein
MTTNAIYEKSGSAITFKDANGTVAFTLKDAVDLGNGQSSAIGDLGATPRPMMYSWEARMKWVATPTLGDIVRLYAYCSDVSGEADLASDADVTPETKFGNFILLGSVICSVAADQYFYAAGVVYLPRRYVVLGVWNASATKDLNATSEACVIKLTPVYMDIQAAS